MNQSLILASAAGNPELAREVLYIPEGRHIITPKTHPKGITITLDPARGAEVAAKLQVDLDMRHAGSIRPIFDFDHNTSGPAAAIPTAFRYEPGKGIMCAVDWTGSGRQAVENRDYSYISPTFLADDDGNPVGLPEKGPVAALVNHPAFKSMRRIAASDAECFDTEFDSQVKERYGRVLHGIDLVEAALAEESGRPESENPYKQIAAADARVIEKYGQPLSGYDLVRAALADEAGDKTVKIRPETREKIRQMREAMEPSAWERLCDMAETLKLADPEMDDDEAKLQAIERRPDLYQEWQDKLPK